MAQQRFRWSWPLARFADIQVSVHATFLLLLLWVAWSVWRHTQNPAAVLQGIGFVLILFVCVVLHEFGHALTARRFGIVTRHITLLPIGGVSAMEGMPDDPKQEMLVAVAGPAVNLVIATLLGLYLSLTNTPPPGMPDDPSVLFTDGGAFLYSLLSVNILLAVFNLLPVFPMDGGRVLRAAFAIFMPHHLATQRAATVGQILAAGMFVLGILYNPILMLIAVFVWLGAAGEAGMERVQHALHGTRAGDVMITRFETLTPDSTLGEAADLAVHTGQSHFPVLSDRDPPRVIDQSVLLRAVREHPHGDAVGRLDLPPLPLVEAGEPADALFRQIQRGETDVAGVVQGGDLVGLVTLSGLAQWIQLTERPSSSMRY